MYIYYIYIIHLPSFINHFIITLRDLPKEKSNHFIAKCSILNFQNKSFYRHSCLACTFPIQFYFTVKR